MTTLLIGCGKIGRRLGLRLTARGEAVVALRRDPSGLPESFEHIAADLSAPLAQLLPPADRLVITLPPPAHDAGYEVALANLAAALPTLPSRTVFVSSTRVFEGWGPEETLNEDSPPRPSSGRAQVLLDGEAFARDRFDAITLRPAGIYGPGRGRLITAVRNGRPVDRTRLTNRIHEVDLVRTIEALLFTTDPPRLLHAVDGQCVAQGVVVDHIAARLDVDPPPAIQESRVSGRRLDGTRLRRFLGSLDYPDHISGYDAVTTSLDTFHHGSSDLPGRGS